MTEIYSSGKKKYGEGLVYNFSTYGLIIVSSFQQAHDFFFFLFLFSMRYE